MSDLRERIEAWRKAVSEYTATAIKIDDNDTAGESYRKHAAMHDAAYAVIGTDHNKSAFYVISSLLEQLTDANARADAVTEALRELINETTDWFAGDLDENSDEQEQLSLDAEIWLRSALKNATAALDASE